jgi:hypothetical protein
VTLATTYFGLNDINPATYVLTEDDAPYGRCICGRGLLRSAIRLGTISSSAMRLRDNELDLYCPAGHMWSHSVNPRFL